MHKNLYKAEFGFDDCQFVINVNISITEYYMSYKGAAGKAFSAHMPVCNIE
jgi:hypothetical protein